MKYNINHIFTYFGVLTAIYSIPRRYLMSYILIFGNTSYKFTVSYNNVEIMWY